MSYTAVIWNNVEISWSGVIVALSVLAAILLALTLRSARGEPLLPIIALSLLAILFSVPLCRLLHWYSNPAQYASFAAAMTDYGQGGYAPLGSFFGTLLAALLLRLCRVIRNLPAALDCCAPAAALGLGLGRLSCLFTSGNRSKFALEGERFQRLPFMVRSAQGGGEEEWRIATFFWEAAAALGICLLLLLLFRRLSRRERFEPEWRRGNVFFLFLALYGALFILLDSTRYDANYFRFNGFVSIAQIFCAAALLGVLVICSVRSVRARGLRLWHFLSWLAFLLCLGGAGYMEYYVQRHGNRFLFSYAVMGICLAAAVLLCCVMLASTGGRRRRPAH